MKTKQLNTTQIQIIKNIADGKAYYFNAITAYRPYTYLLYGADAPMVHGTIMKTMEGKGLIKKVLFNSGGIYKYQLTELGIETLSKL